MSAIETARDALFGNPPNPALEPSREGILAAFTEMMASIGTVGLGSVDVAKTTKALLDADLAYDANSTAIVYADATDANNDLYVKSGASGAGSWTNTGALHSIMEGLANPYIEQFDDILAEVIERSDRLNSLLQVLQSVGYDGTIPDGTNDVAGTFGLPIPIDQRGDGVVFALYAGDAGTVYVQVVERAGTTNTVVREEEVSVDAGYGEYTVADLPHEAGQFFGFRATSGPLRFTIADPGFGYWSSGGTQVAAGDDYTSDEATGVTFHVRIESVKDYANGANAAETDALARQVDNPDYDQIVIGRPAGSTLADGVAAGTSPYVFEAIAPVDMVLKSFSIYGEATGEVELSSWEGTVDDIDRVQAARVTVQAGVSNEFSEPPRLIVRKGGRMGIRSLNGNYALTNPTSEPTPYRVASGVSSGTLGALQTAIRFEFTASFVPYTLNERMAHQEAGLYDHPTEALHVVWIIGESHPAGRALEFASDIPEGRGFRYRRADTSIDHLVDPTGNDGDSTTGAGRGSIGPSIGKAMLDQTNGAVGALIINSGEGSTKVGVEWATAGSAWTQAKADWDAAMTEAAGIPIVGVTIVLWIGSNDADAETAKATFKAANIDLIERAQAYVGAGDNVPVAMIMTGPFNPPASETAVADIQAAQAEIAREVPNAYIASTAMRFAGERFWFLDDVHVTQPANDAIGPAVAAVALARGSGLMPS